MIKYSDLIKYIFLYPIAIIIVSIIDFINLFSYKCAVYTFYIIMLFFLCDITKDKNYYLNLYNLKMFNKKYGLFHIIKGV